MIKILLSILSLVVTQCGSKEIQRDQLVTENTSVVMTQVMAPTVNAPIDNSSDLVIVQIEQDFKNDMAVYGVAVDLSLVKNVYVSQTLQSSSQKNGLTSMLGGVIVLDKGFTREIFYHELGHCIFNLAHSSNPYSIMYYASDENHTDYPTTWQLADMAKQIQDTQNGVIPDYFGVLHSSGVHR